MVRRPIWLPLLNGVVAQVRKDIPGHGRATGVTGHAIAVDHAPSGEVMYIFVP